MMRILVAGATGVLGQHVLPALKARGHYIRALVRSEAKGGALGGLADEIFVGDALDRRSLDGSMRGIDTVISSVGASVSLKLSGRDGYDVVDTFGNFNLIDIALANRVKRFVYIGAHVQPGYAHTAYVRAHERVASRLAQSGLSSCVVRPTAFFTALDPFLDMASTGLAIIPGDGSARTNPVHPADVAEACIEALSTGADSISIGGPDILTREGIAAMAFAAHKRRPRIAHVRPERMLAAAAVAGLLHPRIGQLMEFAVHVSTTECVAPTRGTRRLTDYFAGRPHAN
jgi:uncharacterized protein YbjT (DUF2867 family)